MALSTGVAELRAAEYQGSQVSRLRLLKPGFFLGAALIFSSISLALITQHLDRASSGDVIHLAAAKPVMLRLENSLQLSEYQQASDAHFVSSLLAQPLPKFSCYRHRYGRCAVDTSVTAIAFADDAAAAFAIRPAVQLETTGAMATPLDVKAIFQ